MCGIIAGIAQRDITSLLLDGLKRLQYRGYDSAGVAIINPHSRLERLRTCGKVDQLLEVHSTQPLLGKIGIAHTRWATHGQPSEINAHPHYFQEEIALVHNGIIENYAELRSTLAAQGVQFTSETDSEVIVQCIGKAYEQHHDLLQAVQETLKILKGAYALAIISKSDPTKIIAARQGSPLLIGKGVGEYFIASDSMALLPLTQTVIVLEEGDLAEIYHDRYQIHDKTGQKTTRQERAMTLNVQSTDRGSYRHFMQKEIFEQPAAIRNALAGRLTSNTFSDLIFGASASTLFDNTRAIQIAACGTSFHAGLIASFWMEQIGIPCQIEVASEVRYRRIVVNEGTLFVTLSQSGETADTLAALRNLSSPHYCGKLTICNVPESALVRESELVLLTHAGPEIGVASTKAFITQLIGLLMLVHALGKRRDFPIQPLIEALQEADQFVEQVLTLDPQIAQLAQRFDDKQHALFIARGIHYPIAREGALKLKEISYIHAEAYAAGELKHGPLALVDKHMPVVALVAHDNLFEKIMSNLQEVRARQGELFVFAEKGTGLSTEPGMTVIEVPSAGPWLTPFAFTVLLQLLAYHVAVRKGTDVDQPRNLAKSVTVE